MTNMIGIGPFITIPLLLSTLGGPQAMLGWLVALVITISDGMIWSELGAALPGSGGSYVYLREGFGRETYGRLMGFLFIWQFILSGPLEIASGYIGFTQYLGYIWKDISRTQSLVVIVLLGLLNITLLYRRINFIGKLTVSLWIGTILTTLAVIVTGIFSFKASVAFDFPRCFQFLAWVFSGVRRSHADRNLRLPWLLRHLLYRRRSSTAGTNDSAVSDHQRDRSGSDLHRHKFFSNWGSALARICAG